MEVITESPRKSGDSTSSTEFEFWKMVGNPSNSNSNLFPPSPLLTADELFVNGILLPLHLLSLPPNNFSPAAINVVTESSEDIHNSHNQQSEGEDKQEHHEEEENKEEEVEMASITSCLAPVSVSRRWRDIFKVGEKKSTHEENIKEKEKKSSKERKNSSAGGAAELNINIWPFRRSRSAGDGGAPRPKPAVFSRRISSAPCSRSNSSSSRRCPAASPSRAGIHVGRSSPVWQLKKHKAAAGRKSSGGGGGAGGGLRGINLNMNTCIGYKSQTSCRRDDRGVAGGGGDSGDGRSSTGGGDGGGSLFSLKMIFSKKVY